MIDKAVEKSECFTRGIRIGAYFTMVIGICLFFSPITTIIGYVPLIGGLISGIIGFLILLAALLICIPLYILATSIAWLFYHPKVGLIILGVGIAVLAIVIILTKNSGPQST